jgi:hypothetical protein
MAIHDIRRFFQEGANDSQFKVLPVLTAWEKRAVGRHWSPGAIDQLNECLPGFDCVYAGLVRGAPAPQAGGDVETSDLRPRVSQPNDEQPKMLNPGMPMPPGPVAPAQE